MDLWVSLKYKGRTCTSSNKKLKIKKTTNLVCITVYLHTNLLRFTNKEHSYLLLIQSFTDNLQ